MKIKTRQKYHKISHKGADDYGIFGLFLYVYRG